MKPAWLGNRRSGLAWLPRHPTPGNLNVPKLIERDNPRMVQLGEGLGFAGETLREGDVAARSGRQDLKGHDAVQFLLACPVNRTHAALAHEIEDFQYLTQKQIAESVTATSHSLRPGRSMVVFMSCIYSDTCRMVNFGADQGSSRILAS